MSNRRAPVECDPDLPGGFRFPGAAQPASLGLSRSDRRRHLRRSVIAALCVALIATAMAAPFLL